MICTENDCDRPAFTQKSGFCQRHYDRARTARLAFERPAVRPVRDTTCRECEEKGYHRVEDGVLCQRHWDMLRRRGTTEPARAESRPAATCSVEDCNAVVHATGLCQPHYRRKQRNGSPTVSGVIGRPRRNDSTDHRALDPDEKAARLAERRAVRTHCVNDHELVGDNLFVARDGAHSCRTCRDDQQRAYRRKTVDERTHCRRGHLLTEKNTKVRKNGVRQCGDCNRDRAYYHRYGLTLEQYNAMHDDQSGHCLGCDREQVEGERWLAVDHDRACCSGDQSCGKCVRGLLCTPCNMAVGLLRDDVDTLRRLADYVDAHRARGKV